MPSSSVANRLLVVDTEALNRAVLKRLGPPSVRQLRGTSLESFCHERGICPRKMYRLMAGQETATSQSIDRIAAALGVGPQEITKEQD